MYLIVIDKNNLQYFRKLLNWSIMWNSKNWSTSIRKNMKQSGIKWDLSFSGKIDYKSKWIYIIHIICLACVLGHL